MFFNDFCKPAKIYLLFSILILILIIYQNINGFSNLFCFGSSSCDIPHTYIIIIFKLIYVCIWTYILNLLCIGGLEIVSWIFVVFSIVLFFLLISFLFSFGYNITMWFSFIISICIIALIIYFVI